MTDELRELEQRLAQATAPRSGSQAPLDSEAAALREAWLAFGEMLEAAGEVTPGRLPSPPAPLPYADARSRWLPIAMVALAASVLVAIAVAWHVARVKPSALPSVPQIAESHPAPAAPAAKQVPIVAVETEIAWDDALDQRIEQAGWEVAQVQQDWLAAGASSGFVRYQMEQVKKDIEDSPL